MRPKGCSSNRRLVATIVERWNHGLTQQPGRGLARIILSGAGAQQKNARAVGPRHDPARTILQAVWARRWCWPSNRVGTPPARGILPSGWGRASNWVGARPCGTPFCPGQAILPRPNILPKSIHLVRLIKCPNSVMSNNASQHVHCCSPSTNNDVQPVETKRVVCKVISCSR